LGLFGFPIHILLISTISLILFSSTLIILNKNNELKKCLIKLKELKAPISKKNWKKPLYAIGIIILILMSTIVSFTGTFKTNHFEDSDPWQYACLADYISVEKTYEVGENVDCGSENLYLKPLPRRLTVLFGIYAQTNNEMQNMIKLMFNYFLLLGIISFVLLFYFLFEKNLRKTFFATLFIVSTPAFLGRFIFENNLGLFLLPIALIPLIKITQGDKKWWILGGILLGAQVISHPPTSIFSVLFIAITIMFCGFKERKELFSNNWKKTRTIKLFFSGLIVLAILMMYMIQPFMMYPGEALNTDLTIITFGTFNLELLETSQINFIKQYNPTYNLKTLAKAERSSKMDQATGFGIVLFILMLFSLILVIYKSIREKDLLQRIILVNFLIVSVLFVLGWKSGLALFTSRFWPVVAFYGAIIFAIGIEWSFGKIRNSLTRMFLVVVILLLVYFTSFVQDASIQTSPWPQHKYDPVYDARGYEFVYLNLTPETKVFPICRSGNFLLGLDKKYDYKDPAHIEFHNSLKEKSSREIFSYINSINYDLFTIDTACVKTIGLNKTNELVGYMQTTNYSVIYSSEGFLLTKKP
jgi:hypothetical protein